MKLSKQWLIDTAERVVGTFVAAFVGALVITSDLSIATLQLAGIAGVASAVTVLKSILASALGDSASASLVPSVGQPSPAAVLATPIAEAKIDDLEFFPPERGKPFAAHVLIPSLSADQPDQPGSPWANSSAGAEGILS